MGSSLSLEIEGLIVDNELTDCYSVFELSRRIVQFSSAHWKSISWYSLVYTEQLLH